MNLEKIAEELGLALLEQTKGAGRWIRNPSENQFKQIDNPLKGLSEGDIVYEWDEDKCEIKQIKVFTVVDGVGYVLWNSDYLGPRLCPVDNDSYAVSFNELYALFKEEIDLDFEYHGSRFESVKQIKASVESTQ